MHKLKFKHNDHNPYMLMYFVSLFLPLVSVQGMPQDMGNFAPAPEKWSKHLGSLGKYFLILYLAFFPR